MPCLKIVPEAYMNPDASYVLIHKYVFAKALRIGGLAVDPLHAAEQMEFYRSFFGKQKGRRLYHFIVAFTVEESKHIANEESLAMVAYDICSIFVRSTRSSLGFTIAKICGTSIL